MENPRPLPLNDSPALRTKCAAKKTVDAATLRRRIGAATLLALRRCDAARRARRCDAVDAATLRRRIGAVGAATLRRCKAGTALRRCWRCEASFSNSARSVALQLDALDVYTGHDAMPQHQGTPEYCRQRGWQVCSLMKTNYRIMINTMVSRGCRPDSS